MIALHFLSIEYVSLENFIHRFEKYYQKKFFIFINIFLIKKIKRLIDITGHGLLDIYIMHLFTSNFKLYSALLATKTDFPPFCKKYKKIRIKKLRAYILI